MPLPSVCCTFKCSTFAGIHTLTNSLSQVNYRAFQLFAVYFIGLWLWQIYPLELPRHVSNRTREIIQLNPCSNYETEIDGFHQASFFRRHVVGREVNGACKRATKLQNAFWIFARIMLIRGPQDTAVLFQARGSGIIIQPPLAIAHALGLSICSSVCLSPKWVHKHAIFSKTKQFRAMVFTDDL